MVITAAPHRLNFEEEQGFQKIRQMYASSLVTVFDECIIANPDQGLLCELPEGCGVGRHTGTGNFGSREPQNTQKALHPDDLECFNENFPGESMLVCLQREKSKSPEGCAAGATTVPTARWSLQLPG